VEATLSKHRVEGLTDAIFAIVMTLIVLELKVPELDHHAPNQEIVARILELKPQLVAFLLTFLLSGLFWFLHHSSLHLIKHMTRPLILINLIFMMFVSLLPFSAALLGRFLRAPIAQQVYYGHQLMLSILLTVQWEYVRRKGLLTETATAHERLRMLTRLWIFPLACAAALVASAWGVSAAQWTFVAALLIGRAIFRIRERKLVQVIPS
jgi:uncharacterized membrane protein